MNEQDKVLLEALLCSPTWEAREQAMRIALAHVPVVQRQDALEKMALALGGFARIITQASHDVGGDFEAFVTAVITDATMHLDLARLDLDSELAAFERKVENDHE